MVLISIILRNLGCLHRCYIDFSDSEIVCVERGQDALSGSVILNRE